LNWDQYYLSQPRLLKWDDSKQNPRGEQDQYNGDNAQGR
jgi:hypothetical protein